MWPSRDQIKAAVREGRIGPESARQLLAGLVEQERQVRATRGPVRAHSNAQVANIVHQFADLLAHPDVDLAGEFAKLFPPGQYQPDDDEELSEEHAFAPQRKPTVQQGDGARASVPLSDEDDGLSDEEVARLFPPTYTRKAVDD